MAQKQIPLLQETRLFNPEIIIESVGGRKLIILRGLFQHANVVNENNRTYPLYILEREVIKLQPIIRERKLLGELDHPSEATISLANASHVITEMRMEGDKVVGACELLTTPCGKVASELVDNKITLGISSRGTGDTMESKEIPGVLEVCENYNMITEDLVAEPSTPGAFLSLSEAKHKYVVSATKYGMNDPETKKLLVRYIDEIIRSKML